MARKKPEKTGKTEWFKFKDPYKNYELSIALVPTDNLEVVKHQRKPSRHLLKHLISSMERIGFIVPLIVVQSREHRTRYTIIDGQHRFLAAKDLGIRELLVIIVPEELASKMMNLNIEKELNIREKSHVGLAIYREYIDSIPDMSESESEIADSIEQAYYITLGLAYEKTEKLAGGSFELILKKCDFFLDQKIKDAMEIRKQRAEKILAAYALIRSIAEKLKEMGRWHPYVFHQIISRADPYKGKRLPVEFDAMFDRLLKNLKTIEENPMLILEATVESEG